jgi:uncharacterized membrane protein
MCLDPNSSGFLVSKENESPKETVILKKTIIDMEKIIFEYSNPTGLILMLTGIIFFIAGWVQQKYPPKKINHLYGYRTKTSMRNQEVWKFAQEYSSKKMMKYSLYMILLGALLSFFELEGIGFLWVGLVSTILTPVVMLIEVERELKKRFPKE